VSEDLPPLAVDDAFIIIGGVKIENYFEDEDPTRNRFK
jgi:hypothetical protein